jgi:hypothetical protein
MGPNDDTRVSLFGPSLMVVVGDGVGVVVIIVSYPSFIKPIEPK